MPRPLTHGTATRVGGRGDRSTENTVADTAEYRHGLRPRRTVLESVPFQLDKPPRAAG